MKRGKSTTLKLAIVDIFKNNSDYLMKANPLRLHVGMAQNTKPWPSKITIEKLRLHEELSI